MRAFEPAYLLFLGIDQGAASRLSSSHILAVTDWQEGEAYAPDSAQFVFAVSPAWDTRAPENKLAVTVATYTRAEDWFAFHQDETAHEEQDQSTLESLWSRVHAAMPELGDRVDVKLVRTDAQRGFIDFERASRAR